MPLLMRVAVQQKLAEESIPHDADEEEVISKSWKRVEVPFPSEFAAFSYPPSGATIIKVRTPHVTKSELLTLGRGCISYSSGNVASMIPEFA